MATMTAPEPAAEPVRHVPGEPWTRVTMLDLLQRSGVAVERALLVLYARQTETERDTHTTREHNGQGFGAFDADILTSFAEQISTNKYRRAEGQRLTEKQMELARKKVKKYVGQLVEVANARLGLETPREPRRRRTQDGSSNA